MFIVKNKFKYIFWVEVFLLCYLIKIINKNNVNLGNKINVKVTNDKYGILENSYFQEFLEKREDKVVSISEVNEIKQQLKQERIFKDIFFTNSKKGFNIHVNCLDIIAKIYHKNDEGISNSNLYLLENGEVLNNLKIKKAEKFLVILDDQNRTDFFKFIDIVKYINEDSRLKALINTIYFDEKSIEVSTIYNDSIIGLGNDDIIKKLNKIYKVLFLGEKYNFLDFNKSIVVIDKNKVKRYVS